MKKTRGKPKTSKEEIFWKQYDILNKYRGNMFTYLKNKTYKRLVDIVKYFSSLVICVLGSNTPWHN